MYSFLEKVLATDLKKSIELVDIYFSFEIYNEKYKSLVIS